MKKILTIVLAFGGVSLPAVLRAAEPNQTQLEFFENKQGPSDPGQSLLRVQFRQI